MALLEWTPSAHDLTPVSLHTFEKLPQVAEGSGLAATDPASRMSVLLLPSNTGGDGTLAILPFFQEDIDLESIGMDAAAWGNEGAGSIPYAPSHLIPLASLNANTASSAGPSKSSTLTNAFVNPSGPPPIRNVIDMVFLPGFNEPTLAILYAPEQTWTGRLENISSNYLVSLVTLASNSDKVTSTETTTAVVISTSPSLPYSCLSLCACPPDLGGVLILTADGILHLEQGGKLVSAPANGWFVRDLAMNEPAKIEATSAKEDLEGAQVCFLATNAAAVFCRSGSVLEVVITTSGRSVTALKVRKIGQGVPTSSVERIRGRFGEHGYLLAASETGESCLCKWNVERRAANPATTMNGSAGQTSVRDEIMDLDEDDIDIYGTSDHSETLASSAKNGTGHLVPMISLSVCDTLEHYGGLRDMVTGLVDDDSTPEVVAATGAGPTAGMTVFHRSVVAQALDTLEPPMMAKVGIWSVRSQGKRHIAISDRDQTRILSWPRLDSEIALDGATLDICSIAEGSLIIRVSPYSVQLLDANYSTISSVQIQESAPINFARIIERYIVVSSENTAETFYVDQQARLLAPHTLPYSSCRAVTICLDDQNVMPLVRPPKQRPARQAAPKFELDDADELYGTITAPKSDPQNTEQLERVIELAEVGLDAREWLACVSPEGAFEVFLLPSMEPVFSSAKVGVLPEVIVDGAEVDLPAELDLDDTDVQSIHCFLLGQNKPRWHLFILLENGTLAVYEAVPALTPQKSHRPMSLGCRFVKTAMRRLANSSRRGHTDVDEAPRRDLIALTCGPGESRAVFVTGDEPVWVVASDHGPARVFDAAERNVYGVADVGDGLFAVQVGEILRLSKLSNDICFDREIPYTRVRKDRHYAGLAFDLDSRLYVGGAIFDTEFMLFDDEGKPVFVNDRPDMTNPRGARSCLELIVPGSWKTIDGYEFRPNEFVATLKAVSLATKSTASRRKDFIAVGTAVYRAEDLATRGGVYLFEVIKTNPDPAVAGRTHQLKLLTFEDAKSTKLYARALELDEVLINVGFLDIGMHVTSMQSMKNFLLLGDAVKSLSLIVFQEEPFKLIMLGKDFKPARTANVSFLINESRVAFIAGDESGALRLFEYDPTSVASQAGQKLLCRTEYNAGVEAMSTLVFARRQVSEEARQNGVLYGA
ncbi:mRNA cleavage and polyadenylation factor subunit [Microbotryomycetes sp. JL221]|nr:mRNA cleavage and polyadenylation factor subunit [Microbotryomycetes sp. JL221]